MATDEDELARGRALTMPSRTGVELVERAPQPSPAEVGAHDGFGLGLDEPSLRVSVYVFAGWNAGALAGDRLRDLVDGGPYRALTAVNGALLLFAVAESSSTAGEDILDRVVDAFHAGG